MNDVLEKYEDFVEISRKNLKIINESLNSNSNFDTIANLINYCLGLVVVSYESNHSAIRVKKKYHKRREETYGTILLFQRNKDRFQSQLEDIQYHLRNSICHGGIEIKQKEGQVTEIHFHDYNKQKKGNSKKIILKENFYMILNPDQLRNFIDSFHLLNS